LTISLFDFQLASGNVCPGSRRFADSMLWLRPAPPNPCSPFGSAQNARSPPLPNPLNAEGVLGSIPRDVWNFLGVFFAIVRHCFSSAHTRAVLRRSGLLLGGSFALLLPVYVVFVWVVSNNMGAEQSNVR